MVYGMKHYLVMISIAVLLIGVIPLLVVNMRPLIAMIIMHVLSTHVMNIVDVLTKLSILTMVMNVPMIIVVLLREL